MAGRRARRRTGIHAAAPWFCGPEQMRHEKGGCLRGPSAWGRYSCVESETLLMGK